MAEFLPLCDVLFNVISLAGYFCDVVFDVVLSYALFERGRFVYFAVVITLVMVSLIISQIVSLRWYLHKVRGGHSDGTSTDSMDKKKPITPTGDDDVDHTENSLAATAAAPKSFGRYCVIVLHCTQLGVLWRYAKLFVPVDLRHVKHEVRDLCMLRLVHAFCEAAPMLLLQLYILVTIQKEEAALLKPELPLQTLGVGHVTPVIVQPPTINQQHQLRTFKDLNIVSSVLSLFSVCWALASFSKNVRIQNVHRLVLTWLGVIFQFLWRLGTVVSRVAALTMYASVYNHWVFLVITLHWVSMFFWLISPKNVFHGERISRVRKATLAGLIAFVYVFAYINLQEVNHRQKMITFYVVMFLENSLLVFLWLIGTWVGRPDNWYVTPLLIFASFATGILFMLLYYRYFHVRRLGYEAGGRLPNDLHSKYACADGSICINLNICQQKYPTRIPGVFNCRFSNSVASGAAARRKKKKPTTFVPLPNLNMQPAIGAAGCTGNAETSICTTSNTGLMSIPFWRRPITRSNTGGSENEGSAGSRVNIHQKLQEKKQKQLAELKIIEEEIKQGKLGGPSGNNILGLIGDDGRASLPRQPIPHAKKHINLEPQEWRTSSPEPGTMFNDLNVMPSPNIDDINNLNTYTRSYDPLYNSFGLNGINIPAIAKDTFNPIETNNQRNMSPISSQISAAESNSIGRQIVPRTKILHNAPHRIGMYMNHPRQISGTYSSNVPNADADSLPFPYNVIPPPRSKLDSRGGNDALQLVSSAVATAPSVTQQQRLHLQRQLQRAETPEILLAPHYLDNSRAYYDLVARERVYRLPNANGKSHQHQAAVSSGDENLDDYDDSVLGIGQNGYRIPSDIDSQVSLPRSYTLPREFKYYRRNKGRKLIKNEHFINSTNSSDGDVDSGDDNDAPEPTNNSQRCAAIRLQTPPTIGPSTNVPQNVTNIASSSAHHHLNANFLHSHRSGNASKTASPITVANVYASKELNKSTPLAPSPMMSAASLAAQTNLLNNLHHNVHIGSESSSSNNNSSRGGAQSPNIAINVPNYLNVSTTTKTNNNNNLNGGNVNGLFNGSLDLLNGVENANGSGAAALNRQLRLRAYGNGVKNGMIRHETKL